MDQFLLGNQQEARVSIDKPIPTSTISADMNCGTQVREFRDRASSLTAVNHPHRAYESAEKIMLTERPLEQNLEVH